MKINYSGWELKYFDNAKFFRKYQFDLIKKHITGSTAEIGPGNGTNIRYYLNYVSNIDCYEPSKNLYTRLKKKFLKKKKIKIFKKKFKNIKKKYNTILYLDVLEHIKNDKQEFFSAYSSLKKGGKLIINVPAFNFLYSEFDKDIDHIKRYKKKDFENMLKRTRYKKKELFYYDFIGFILSLFAKIFSKNYKSNFGLKIKFWDLLIPVSRILDKLTFYSFGKSLICVVEKN